MTKPEISGIAPFFIVVELQPDVAGGETEMAVRPSKCSTAC